MDTLWKKLRGKSHSVDQDVRQKGLQQMLQYKRTVQHGFPNRPSALAYDPKLRIIAIGTQSGSIKIYGSPGVECYAQHETDIVVNHIVFLPNQGRFVSICEDNTVYLWEIASRDKSIFVECINNVKLEGRSKKISTVCLASVGDQLYIGTEGGNVHVLNYNTFEFTEASTIYIDNATQNSASPSRASPGAVEALAENPVNCDQLLIGYNKGLMVIWDFKEQKAVRSFWAGQQLESLSWSSDGARFYSSHNDGSYIAWDPRMSEPAEKPNFPYGPFPCKPIPKLLWKTSGGSHPFIVFSGGMPRSRYGDHQTVTVMQGDNHVVFDFTSRVVDFFTVDSSGVSDTANPEALVVLLEEELIAVDLTTEKWPIFQLPYLFVMHSSSITCSHHVSSVSEEFWDALTHAGRQQERGHFSSKPWPISGGHTYKESNENRDIFLTGHEDGSVRFWDVSGNHLRILYTLKTANLFKTDDMDGDDEEIAPAEEEEAEEWPPFRKTGSFDPFSDDPRLAVQKVEFCMKTNVLLVAGTSGQIVVFDFKKIPKAGKTMDHVTVNLVGDRDGFVWKGHSPLKLKTSVIKSESGFQPHTVVQIMPPAACTALTLQSEWQLFGAGTAHGFVLLDYNRWKAVVTRCTLQNLESVNGLDPSMTRRKSFKKSLRESFRRMRRGRSQMAIKRGPDGDKASPSRDVTAHIETRPVEREIEARAVDNEMASVVRCLQLVSCYILNNVVSSPTFWVGTNSGGVLIYTLVLPLAENRREEEVHASLSKEIQLQHHAPVVHVAAIDAHGCPVNEKPSSKDSSIESSQKVVICSEEQFKIFHLPSLKPYTKFKLTASEGALIRKVRIVRFASRSDDDPTMREYCLACLTNQGDIHIFSLPSLQRLLKQECIKRENIHGITTLTFTKTGQGFYQKSPSEFQRFTLTARNVMEPLCAIDIPDNMRLAETPRPPHSPLSHTSNSPRLRSLNKSSPESGISINNHVYARNINNSGMRSPDTSNLNESIKSETSGEDSIRIYPVDGHVTVTQLRSPDKQDRAPSS
ncbi:lethal(2) giant larvae protein homolog 1-like [Paramacrobiotus metropolitanus]|uniref:lethal(2) giant larvae protein homolog 1-like n=1 Tax=Paramacrobiotus metropolitanus TaxID=2943436 RepID=UPI002445976B|nr:lethal(2) giant larvae protein homolog 1-like [Paramacrobiotus metropolitanus]XP_055338668.1 lethal(2) giant larvae protein homolog 1-like [Paramacrobiotus metropolitanus]XP_055338670.1 lethal(2) giant larvae protein homolog 1-like [Paramacrobiotus metropolitanus]XP_055338671.1 lethal(2) giant larvae protein homolog 1-like [Paramacrobiotus metropolitanus]